MLYYKIKNGEKMNKKYYPYIDIIRVLSMLCIIILHSASYGLRANYFSKTWWVLNLITSVATCAVPLFFMISGAMLLSNPKTDDIAFNLKQRLPALMLPLLFWSFACVARDFYYIKKNLGIFDLTALWQELIKIPQSPVSVHLWFMYAIIPLYVIAPFVKKIIADERLAKYLMALWIIACGVKTLCNLAPESIKSLLDISLFNKINYIDGFLGYFVLGWYLHNKKISVKNVSLQVLIPLQILVICFGTAYATRNLGEYCEIFKSYTSIWVIILSALLYITALKIKEITPIAQKMLGYISSLSLGIYLSGNFFLGIMRQEGMVFESGMGFVLCTLYTLVLCTITIAILKFIPIINYVATGNRK